MKLGHIGIPVTNLKASKDFYDAIISSIGLEKIDEGEESVRYGENGSARFYIHRRSEAINGIHVCFEVDNEEEVDNFYNNALAAGGTDNGAPDIRHNYSPTYYAAFVLDPDNNNIEAVFRG